MLHPKTNISPKKSGLQYRNLLLQWSIFRGYVSLPNGKGFCHPPPKKKHYILFRFGLFCFQLTHAVLFGGCATKYRFLEPKWPLFWLEKALFWRGWLVKHSKLFGGDSIIFIQRTKNKNINPIVHPIVVKILLFLWPCLALILATLEGEFLNRFFLGWFFWGWPISKAVGLF